MAISVNHSTKVISVPQADLTLISGSLYEMNINTYLKAQLAGYLDDEGGVVLVDMFKHNTEVTVGGVTLARVLEIINGYTITFTPDSQWAVRLAGGNNNIADVLNVNQVQLRSANSAGMVVSGSGVTAQDKVDIANETIGRVIEAQGSYTLKQALSIILSVLAGVTANNGATFKTADGAATRVAATISGSNRTNMTLTPSA